MLLKAISKFSWRGTNYEIGQSLEAEDVIGERMIREGLVEEAHKPAHVEVGSAPVEPAAVQSEPTKEEESQAGDLDKPSIVTQKKHKSKKKKG